MQMKHFMSPVQSVLLGFEPLKTTGFAKPGSDKAVKVSAISYCALPYSSRTSPNVPDAFLFFDSTLVHANINHVAIGAPRIGETCVQIAQTPKHGREPRDKSSENVEKPLLRGGGDGKLLTRGWRCSSAKVQLGNPGLK